MKKGIKSIVFGTLLVAGVAGLIHINTSAWHGHGHGGHHGGHRRRHHGHHGWRRRGWGRRGWGGGVYIGVGRPWYRRRWWGRPYDYPRPVRTDWRDDKGKMFWRVANNSNRPLIVESDTYELELAPGESGNLKRTESYRITVKSESGRTVRTIETDRHFIEL